MSVQNTRRLIIGFSQSNWTLNSASDPLRETLAQLLSSSDILHVAVWIDGEYTPEEELANSTWAEGRELYFKIEGRQSRNSAD